MEGLTSWQWKVGIMDMMTRQEDKSEENCADRRAEMEMGGDSFQTMLPEHPSSDIAVAQRLVHRQGRRVSGRRPI